MSSNNKKTNKKSTLKQEIKSMKHDIDFVNDMLSSAEARVYFKENKKHLLDMGKKFKKLDQLRESIIGNGKVKEQNSQAKKANGRSNKATGSRSKKT
jgi:hypothetical protein